MVAKQRRGERQHPHELTREEGWALLDEAARHYMNMSGAEFLAKWDAGEITASHDRSDHIRVMDVASLIPFVR